jgi:hypothetical protein
MRKITALALLPVLILTGCTVGPKYKRPAFQTPTNFYTEEQAKQNSLGDLAWWDLFKDPILEGLVREALRNNYDLQLEISEQKPRFHDEVSRSLRFVQSMEETDDEGAHLSCEELLKIVPQNRSDFSAARLQAVARRCGRAIKDFTGCGLFEWGLPGPALLSEQSLRAQADRHQAWGRLMLRLIGYQAGRTTRDERSN